MDTRDTLLELFRSEASDKLNELEALIESLRDIPSNELQAVLQQTMRYTHSLKGGASVVNEQSVERLAHALEDALQRLLDIDSEPSEALWTIMCASVSVMQQIIAGQSLPNEVEELSRDLERASPGRATGEQGHGDRQAGDIPQPATSKSESAWQGGSVRIETARLDRLMGYAGELLTARSRLAGISALVQGFNKSFHMVERRLSIDGDPTWTELSLLIDEIAREDRASLRSFSHLTEEISAAMKQVRMLPMRDVAPMLSRVVERTAEKLGKDVQLTLELGDTELDRYLLDRLREPLIHFLRNAVDHAIEPAEERRKVGKPEAGTILVRTAKAGNMVQFEISDDGRGIDLQHVTEVAIRRGLLNRERAGALDERETLELLFQPGFSTAEEVSQVSGRGAGLDVVKLRIEELGGKVEISPRPTLGGTTFYVTVPLSLLSAKGLLMRAGESTYAVAIDSVVTTERVASRALEESSGPVLARDDAEPLRVRWMSALMGESAPRVRDKLNVVVFGRDRERLGVVVDDVLSEQEVVTKRLPWNLKRVPGVNGAVILADGSLALDVDVDYLFAATEAKSAVVSEVEPAAERGARFASAAQVLVVDDSLTVRTMLRNMLAEADYAVTTAEDGEDAWAKLQEKPFDLAVLDVQMPRLDGLALTRRIRQNPVLRDLSVLLVTDLGSAEDIARGAEAGADEYLVKGSFAKESLLQAVARLL